MSLEKFSTKSVVRHRTATPCLLKYYTKRRIQGFFNDVIIEVGDERIEANKMVLSCYCKYFEETFLADPKTDSVEVEETDVELFKNIINYICNGEVEVNAGNVLKLLDSADKFHLEDVKQFCFEFLRSIVTLQNCLAIYKAVNHHINPAFKQVVYKLISRNYETISQTEEFLHLTNLELFPCIFHLNREQINEEILCKSLVDWARHNLENRGENLSLYMKFIRIDQLCYQFLLNFVSESSEILRESEDCLNNMCERMQELRNVPKIVSGGGVETAQSIIEIRSCDAKSDLSYPDLPFPLCQHRLLKWENFLYCIGGKHREDEATREVWKMNLDESTLIWEEASSLNVKRYALGASVYEGALVVVGGYDGKMRLSSTEVFIKDSFEWSMLQPLKQYRSGNELVACGKHLYTLGGWDGVQTFSSVECLSGLREEWQDVAEMQTSRWLFAAVNCNDVMYAIGGVCARRGALKTVEKYDSDLDKWIYVASLNIGRYTHAACVLCGKIYVVGGLDSQQNTLKEIECYNPSIDSWEIVGKTDIGLRLHSLFAL